MAHGGEVRRISPHWPHPLRQRRACNSAVRSRHLLLEIRRMARECGIARWADIGDHTGLIRRSADRFPPRPRRGTSSDRGRDLFHAAPAPGRSWRGRHQNARRRRDGVGMAGCRESGGAIKHAITSASSAPIEGGPPPASRRGGFAGWQIPRDRRSAEIPRSLGRRVSQAVTMAMVCAKKQIQQWRAPHRALQKSRAPPCRWAIPWRPLRANDPAVGITDGAMDEPVDASHRRRAPIARHDHPPAACPLQPPRRGH